MKNLTGKFISWLMSRTAFLRYLIVAILFHVLILFVLGSIKIVTVLPKIIASFDFAAPPPVQKHEEMDPFAALRDFSYRGPTLGGGGGTSEKGAGGIPTAAGLKDANIPASEVMSVINESIATAMRSQSDLPATTGLGESKIGTGGINGPGGGGFSRSVGPIHAQKIQAGSTAEMEKALLAALHWLKNHQATDGSWKNIREKSPRLDTTEGFSALAVLAFLGHGETPDSPEFGSTISQGIAYIASCVGQNGIVNSQNMYAQGAVMRALAEAYAVTQSPNARKPLERAVAATLLSQKAAKTKPIHTGGWRYSPQSSDSDTSATGWVLLGLKSAQLAGIPVSDDSFEMASGFLWNMYGDEGFGYDQPGRHISTSAVGILCQQSMGHGDDIRIKKSLDTYKSYQVDWGQTDHLFVLCGWYYITQAMFQAGGAYWIHWDKEIRNTIVKAQDSDGHWEPPPKCNDERDLGPVYATTICCLTLEVYYRYLLLYQDMEHKAARVPAK